MQEEVKPAMAVGGAAPIQRKALAPRSKSPESQTTELTGEGVRRELSGRDIHPFPIISPSSPISVPGEHEVHGDGLSRELPAESRSPPPVYSRATASQPRSGEQVYEQGQLSELGT
jgi:hypothetical protein